MNADSRLVQERLKQVPQYVAMFGDAYGDEPHGGRIYGALAEFLATLRTEDAPFMAYLDGEEGALSEEALRGLELFTGKAGRAECHSGPTFSDGGVPNHPELATDAEQQITMLRHYATQGVPNYMNRREDLGFLVVSEDEADQRKFATSALWDVGQTGPYMHSGAFETLDEVVAFYDRGAGERAPLALTSDERAALVALLESLTSAAPSVTAPETPPYGDAPPEVQR